MAWKARLHSVPAVAVDVTDSFEIQVEYHDDVTGRAFQQSLKLTAGNVQTVADVRAITDDRIAKLKDLDRVRNVLAANVGQDL